MLCYLVYLLLLLSTHVQSFGNDNSRGPISSFLPEQIHLSLTGDATQMSVQWSTAVDADKKVRSIAQWDVEKPSDYDDPKLANSNQGDAPTVFTDQGGGKFTQLFHVATMTELLPYTTYYYRVGCDDYGWSDVFEFRSSPDDSYEVS